MDSALLAEGIDYLLEQDGFDIHSLTVIRDGHIVTDAYFYPFRDGWLHDLASVTKSFTSTLVGMAIDAGDIEGVEQSVLDLMGDRSVANVDSDKESMTVEDLLTMSPGFECTHDPPDATTMEMMTTPDWVQFAIDQPMTATPGTRWVYCSPGSHLLSAIIQESTGMKAADYASERLFAPLGITDVVWATDPRGYNRGWGDLMMAPHDMAKLGYLYLHGGEWDGQPVLPAEWVRTATSPAVVPYYGYQWWLDPAESVYLADGRGGQRIFVFPERDLVVATTGGGGRDQYGVLDRLLDEYILPAVKADDPLPPDPEGQASLDARVREAAAPSVDEAMPVPPLPETARRVSGRTFVLDANPVGAQSATLTFPGGAEASFAVRFADGSGFEWLIGLDGVPRLGTGLGGLPAAATGAWTSDDEFVIELDEIGGIDKDRATVTIDGDRATFQGLGVVLTGALEG
jgi:CubicO group peptidase (beta-lactamase class C family)